MVSAAGGKVLTLAVSRFEAAVLPPRVAGMSESRSSLAPLRHPNFRWYFVASAVNLVGNTMAGVALAFAVLSIDNSASALGLVLAANTVPFLLFLLLGGVIS